MSGRCPGSRLGGAQASRRSGVVQSVGHRVLVPRIGVRFLSPELSTLIAFPGHAGRSWSLLGWRLVARNRLMAAMRRQRGRDAVDLTCDRVRHRARRRRGHADAFRSPEATAHDLWTGHGPARDRGVAATAAGHDGGRRRPSRRERSPRRSPSSLRRGRTSRSSSSASSVARATPRRAG